MNRREASNWVKSTEGLYCVLSPHRQRSSAEDPEGVGSPGAAESRAMENSGGDSGKCLASPPTPPRVGTAGIKDKVCCTEKVGE